MRPRKELGDRDVPKEGDRGTGVRPRKALETENRVFSRKELEGTGACPRKEHRTCWKGLLKLLPPKPTDLEESGRGQRGLSPQHQFPVVF